MDCSPPGSSVHGIHQARILEWVAISFSRGSSQPRDWTRVSCIADKRFTIWVTREALSNLNWYLNILLYIFLTFVLVLMLLYSTRGVYGAWKIKRKQIPMYKHLLQCRRPGFNPWVGKIPWRRKWQPTPVLLPGKFHGLRSLVGYSPWGHKELGTTEWLFTFTEQ